MIIDESPQDMTEQELDSNLKASKFPNTSNIPSSNLSDLFKVPETKQFVYEKFSEDFERFKVKVDLFKWLIGTVGLTLITYIINWGFKDREQGLAEIQIYDKYASQAVVFAENPNNRVLLAQFFANVTPSDKLRERWKDYLIVVNNEKDIFNKRLKRINDTLKSLARDTNKSEKNKKVFIDVKEKQAELERIIDIKLVDEKAPVVGVPENISSKNLALALAYETKGFDALMAKDIDGAITNFRMSEKSYNGYHNAFDISQYLVSIRSNFSNDSKSWQAVYDFITKSYSWQMPPPVMKQWKVKTLQ